VQHDVPRQASSPSALIRRLVISVGLVGFRRICAAQVRRLFDPTGSKSQLVRRDDQLTRLGPAGAYRAMIGRLSAVDRVASCTVAASQAGHGLTGRLLPDH
jgi:hypothetical protein